jgi:hypothetical protein
MNMDSALTESRGKEVFLDKNKELEGRRYFLIKIRNY